MVVAHPRRVRALLVTALTTVLAASGALLGHAAAWVAPPAPTVVEQATTQARLRWGAVPDAPGYRVKFSTSPAWTSSRYALTTTPEAVIGGLTPATTYYVKVRVAEPDGTNLGPYSPTITVRTPASGHRWVSPDGLKVTAATVGSLTLSWRARGTTDRYRLQYSSSPTMSDSRFRRVRGTTGTLDGLAAGTTWYVRVRVIDAEGADLSRYSAAIQARTASLASSLPAPRGVDVTSRARSSLALSWKAVPGAPAYRVKYSTSRSWSGARYALVTKPYAELTGLKPGSTHYLKVRATTTADQALSGYSATVAGSTRSATSFPYLKPLGLTVTEPKGSTATLSWSARGKGLSYRVRYDTGDGYTSPEYVITSSTTLRLQNLRPAAAHVVSVRVVAADGAALSEYSATAGFRTTTQQAPLRVATYNVKCHLCFAGAPNERSWFERRDAVTALIKAQRPDVIALQEAQQSRLRNPDGSLQKRAQFEDLLARLGAPYKVTNQHRYDCVRSTTKTGCEPMDRETSRGIRIFYNSAEVELLDHGARRLSYLSADDMERFVAWAIFHQIDSGKDFLVADVHFENKDDLTPESTAYYELRKQQAREALAEVNAHNPKKLPVIFAGDLNSTKWTSPDNAPYRLLLDAGYVDPLGNGDRSREPSGATVEHRIRTEYNSYNRWLLAPPKADAVNGSYYDYLLTSGPMRVSEWENAMNLDPYGRWVGVIPSDHHLLRATVWLP